MTARSCRSTSFPSSGSTVASVERYTIAFPCADDDQQQNFPPFTQMLKEVVEQIEVRTLVPRSSEETIMVHAPK